jgi:hypothetical protein
LRRFGDSCGHPELPRCDADEALEMMAEHALVRKAGAGGDLRQGQAALQQLLGPLDAPGDDVPVRRLTSGRLELPREVVDAEAGDSGHLLQGRAGVEVVLDVLHDQATHLPVRVEAYDHPRPNGPAEGDLLESYSYLDLRCNVGLVDEIFDPRLLANELTS